MKNHQHHDSGTRKSEHENFEKREFQGKNKITIWKQKPQSNKGEEESMLVVISLTTGTQNFIQAQSLFIHVLSNIVGGLDRKANE